MSFLAPFFLWLIPLTVVPLIIHLLNKKNIINIDFSSLIFLKQIENESIKKIHLLQLLLLILRILIILIIILMISRPIINSSFSDTKNSTYSVILIDDSFSSTSQIDLLKNNANYIINSIDDKAEILWINNNSSIVFNGLKEDMPLIDNILKRSYLSSPISNSIKRIKSSSLNILANKELFILTDMKHSNIEEVNKVAEELNDFNIYTVFHPPLTENLSITKVNIINEVFTPNDKISIEIYIENSGTKDIKDKSLNLIIDNMNLGQQLVSIDAGKAKKYTFKTIIGKYGINNCLIDLESDDDNGDNKYYFTIDIPEKQTIAIISTNEELAYYINESINALNKLSNTFNVDNFSTFNTPNFNINKYDIVFLLNHDLLDQIEDSRIEEFLYNSGHFILFPDLDYNPTSFNNINKISSQIIEDYTEISLNTLQNNSYKYLEFNNNMEALISVFDPKGDNINPNIKLFTYLELPSNSKITKLLDESRKSVWNRHILDTGMIDIFGFSLDLRSTTFPISGSFIPFVNLLLYSNTSLTENIYKYTDQKWLYKPKTGYFENLSHELPNGDLNIVSQFNKNFFLTDILEYPGFHNLYSKNKKLSTISVNIDSRAFESNNSNTELIKKYINKSIINLNIKNNKITSNINEIRSGKELWRYLIYLLAILIIIEMIISNVTIKRK